MSMKDLFDEAHDEKKSLPIMQGTNETGGMLFFSYSFGDKFEMIENHSTLSSILKEIILTIMVEGIVQVISFVIFT